MLEHKDYLTFIGMARKIPMDDGLPFKFVAAGDGPDRQMIIRESSALAQQGSMVFPDPEMDVANIVKQANVGVLLFAQREGCSNSIMEYMAFGVPFLCNDAGGNRELVLDGITGYPIPNLDLSALVTRLPYFCENPAERVMMVGAEGKRIPTEFSVPTIVPTMIDVYSQSMNAS